MRCEHCGTQIPDESKLCPQCSQTHITDNPPSASIPKQKRRKWPWVLGFIVLVLGALAWLGSHYGIPQDAIAGQLTSLSKGQFTEAYYDHTSKDFQKAVSLEAFKKYVRSNPILANAKSFLVEDETLEGTISTIRGFVITEDGSSQEAVYKLILEDDKWKVLSFSPILRSASEDAPQSSITKQVIEPVQTFLGAIQKPEFPQIFQSKLSKHFLQNTTFEDFNKLLRKNPVLQSFSDYEIIEHQFNRGRGELIIVLNPEKEQLPTAFTVIKEDGVWKIFRISLGAPKEEEALKTTELFETILVPYVKNSIQLLKDKNIDQFYQDKTSEEFRIDVSSTVLKDFVDGFPLLTHFTDIAVKERGESGDLYWMDVEIKKGQEAKVIEFTLEKEQGDWKILGMKLFDHDSIQ